MPPTLYFVFRSPGPRSRNLRWFLPGVGVACRERILTNFLAGVSGCIATVCGVLLAFVFACKDRTTANFLAGVSVPKGTATTNVSAGVSVLCWYVFACRDRTVTNCLAEVFRLYCYRVWRAAGFCVCFQGQNYREFSGRCFCA